MWDAAGWRDDPRRWGDSDRAGRGEPTKVDVWRPEVPATIGWPEVPAARRGPHLDLACLDWMGRHPLLPMALIADGRRSGLATNARVGCSGHSMPMSRRVFCGWLGGGHVLWHRCRVRLRMPRRRPRMMGYTVGFFGRLHGGHGGHGGAAPLGHMGGKGCSGGLLALGFLLVLVMSRSIAGGLCTS